MDRSKGALAFEAEIVRRKLKYRQVEEIIGSKPDSGQVTRLVNGQRLPGRDMAYRIWKAFGVPMSAWLEPASQRKAS